MSGTDRHLTTHRRAVPAPRFGPKLGPMAAHLLTDDEIDEALEGLHDDWERDGDSIVRSITAKTFAAGIELVDSVALVADERDHHPDIDIRWTTVTFRLSTHSEGGLTDNDVDLAKAIDSLA